jgi:hypothetical protein
MAIQQLSIPDGSQSGEAINQGSVLAVVRFPDTQGRDCNGVGKFGKLYQLRLDYDRLIELESGKIRDMLKPKSQERFRRLLKMDSLPPGIDYVLDFTPTEDEGAAELMISLWLPDSTKIWWMAGHYKPQQLLTSPTSADGRINTRPLADRPIGAVLVLGHDDECSCYTTYSDISDIWAKKEDVPCICHGIWEPLYRRKEKIKDFCRIRARMNVVRILRAIAGEDLLVNSATRMWTLANLADLLEVVPIVVSNRILAQQVSKSLDTDRETREIPLPSGSWQRQTPNSSSCSQRSHSKLLSCCRYATFSWPLSKSLSANVPSTMLPPLHCRSLLP